MPTKVRLEQWSGVYSIAQLPHDEIIPEWVHGDGFINISRTDDELSLVCLQQRVPSSAKIDGGWTLFKFRGPFAFDEAGIILSVVRPLSENGMGVFVVSTFDGDVILVREANVEQALVHLREAGHQVC